MFQKILEEDLKRAVKKIGIDPIVKGVDIVCSIPENSQFGDYTTNIALQVAKLDEPNRYHSSIDAANDILGKLGHPPYLERIEVAGPGFINFFLKEESLFKGLISSLKKVKKGKRIIVEYADPNTHKAFHIGHLRPLTVGESIARLLEWDGNEVFRSNYGSDIGLTVAKVIWGIGQMQDEYKAVKDKGSLRDKANFLGKAYAFGHKQYESKEQTKELINALVRKLYQRDSEVLPLWEETKGWSLAYFDSIYSRFGTKFDRIISESEVEEQGKKIVEDYIGKIFIKDSGAVIFPGEKYGLHRRVFLTGLNHPTYEAKELGLTRLYQKLYPFDEWIILSHNEQISFFKVVIKAMELIDGKLIGKKRHLSYGTVSLPTGKISSRSGNVIEAEAIIDEVKKEIIKQFGKATPLEEAKVEKIAIAAIKFSLLKYSMNSDISFDIEKSVSVQGDSGPYLLYTYARSKSLLHKADKGKNLDLTLANIKNQRIEVEERELLRQLEYFEVMVGKAAGEFEPNLVCFYLLELAKVFNLFYQKYPILGSKQEKFRLVLTNRVAEVLKCGLELLGIEVLERM